uniref:WSN domain-containing protein n=1 Tax=Caenorhabditis tropicalis TaxID=1561998 RepID=A0A1I7UA20_9PELO
MRPILWIWILSWMVSGTDGFLWTLFGGNNCNCCRCSAPRLLPPMPTFVRQYQSSYSFSYSPPAAYQTPTAYTVPIVTTPSYRGPPAAAPISQEQLFNERKYATNQVAYHSETRPVTVTSGYGDQALSQLEDELASEKYKYNLQKSEKAEKKKQGKIRVFKIKPHKSSKKIDMGMVEWQSSQVAEYTNEKAVEKFIEATSDTNGINESLEEFIPIEIGSEPEFADEEPAGPPPNVRNRMVIQEKYSDRKEQEVNSIFKPISNLFEPYALVTNALTLQSKLYDPEINIAAELLNLEPSILDDLLKFDKNKTRKAYQQSISKFPLETGEQFLGYLDKVVKLRDDWKVVKGDIKELEAINDVIIDLKEEYYSFYSVNPLDELLTNLEAFNKDPSAWDQTKEEAAGKIVNEILNLDLGKFDDDLLPFKSLNLSICMESQNRTMTFFASMAEIASLNPEFPGNPENLLVAGLEGVESLYKSFQALKNLGNLPVNDLEKALESPLYQETFKVASEDLAHLLQPVFSISKKVAKLREKISENKDFLKRNLVHLQKSLALGTPCGPLDLTPLKQIPKPKPLDPICKPSAEAHLAKLIASSTKLANLDWTTDQKTLGLISGVFDLDTYKEASESAKKLEENVMKWHSAIGSVKDSMKTVIEGLGNLKVDKNIIKQLESFFEESTLDIIHKSCGLGVERSALIKELGSFDLEILRSTVRKIEEEVGKEETIPFAMKEWVYHKHIELNFMAGYKVYGIFDRVQGKENEIKELIMENEKVMKELRLQGKQVPTVISWTSGISDFEKMIKNLDELKANMTHLKTQNDLKSQVPKISTVFDPNLKISELLEQYELLRHSISPPESLQKARELGQKVEGIELSWSSHRAFLQYPNATSELDEYLKTVIEKEKASRNLVYMRYRKIPTGFAPFNLTPCQIMYEFFAELGSSNQVSVALIDSMMYVMTNGASFEDFYPIGAGLAAQRAKSMDLVTTAQIEFALYVCFKIINDESQYEQPMFNEEKTEFLRDLEDAWAVSWLQNYEEFEKYWGSKDFNRVYTPMENELHWYPQVKPKLEKTKESVVKFMERRRAFAKSMRKPDPYKKEEKKEEKKEGKKEEKKKNL